MDLAILFWFICNITCHGNHLQSHNKAAHSIRCLSSSLFSGIFYVVIPLFSYCSTQASWLSSILWEFIQFFTWCYFSFLDNIGKVIYSLIRMSENKITVEEVKTAINILYKGDDVSKKDEVSRWLEHFQQSVSLFIWYSQPHIIQIVFFCILLYTGQNYKFN